MSTPTPTCESCRFLDPYDSTCHRSKPPTAGFPFVKLDDWCGDHKPLATVTENNT